MEFCNKIIKVKNIYDVELNEAMNKQTMEYSQIVKMTVEFEKEVGIFN